MCLLEMVSCLKIHQGRSNMFSQVEVLGWGAGEAQPEVKWGCSLVFAYLTTTQHA